MELHVHVVQPSRKLVWFYWFEWASISFPSGQYISPFSPRGRCWICGPDSSLSWILFQYLVLCDPSDERLDNKRSAIWWSDRLFTESYWSITYTSRKRCCSSWFLSPRRRNHHFISTPAAKTPLTYSKKNDTPWSKSIIFTLLLPPLLFINLGYLIRSWRDWYECRVQCLCEGAYVHSINLPNR